MQSRTDNKYFHHYKKLNDTLKVLVKERDQLKLKLHPNPESSLIANADPLDHYEGEKPNPCCCGIFSRRPYKSNSSRQQFDLKNLQIAALEQIKAKLEALYKFRQPGGETWGETFVQIGVVASAVYTYGAAGALDDPCMIAFEDLKDTLDKYDENNPVMKGSTKTTINRIKMLVKAFPYITDGNANTSPGL